MNFIQKLFPVVVIFIRVGKIVINLSSKLAAEDYFGATLDAVALLSILWARRTAIRKLGGHLLGVSKTIRRKIKLHANRFISKRR